MESAKKSALEIIEGIKSSLNSLESRSVEEFVAAIASSNKILAYGAGRSGMVAKSFAMRLSQLGRQSFVVGETTTPAIKKGDCLIAISSSGTTASVVSIAEKAKSVGAKILTVTSVPESKLGMMSDNAIIVKNKTSESQISPLGTIFEDSALVLLDGIVVEMMQKLKKTEKQMKENHANLE